MAKLMRFSEVLTHLPNVNATKTRKLFRDGFNDWANSLIGAGCQDRPLELDIGGRIIDDAAYHEMYRKDGAIETSPRGAQFLIELYLEGRLPTKREPMQPSEALLSYARTGETFAEIFEARRLVQNASREADEEAKKTRYAAPEKIPPSEFTYGLLNELFFHHKKKGYWVFSMMVGGVEVTKTVSRYQSNSGKNSDASVTFSWTDPDGTPRKLEKTSKFEGNRRNDEARNWGLPE